MGKARTFCESFYPLPIHGAQASPDVSRWKSFHEIRSTAKSPRGSVSAQSGACEGDLTASDIVLGRALKDREDTQ